MIYEMTTGALLGSEIVDFWGECHFPLNDLCHCLYWNIENLLRFSLLYSSIGKMNFISILMILMSNLHED